MSKVIEFFKNLFKLNQEDQQQKSEEQKPVIAQKYDIFGDLVTKDDKFVVVSYNECKRRGYFTVRNDYKIYDGENVRFFPKIVKYDSLVSMSTAYGTKASKREGYIHIFCRPQKMKEA